MNPQVITNFTEAERQFILKNTEKFQERGQLCELQTNTEHSVYQGYVTEVDPNGGGIVFQLQETGSHILVPVSLVGTLREIQATPQSESQSQQKSRGRAAGSTSNW